MEACGRMCAGRTRPGFTVRLGTHTVNPGVAQTNTVNPGVPQAHTVNPGALQTHTGIHGALQTHTGIHGAPKTHTGIHGVGLHHGLHKKSRTKRFWSILRISRPPAWRARFKESPTLIFSSATDLERRHLLGRVRDFFAVFSAGARLCSGPRDQRNWLAMVFRGGRGLKTGSKLARVN